MGYLPIEDYGVIGDTHTVALIGKNGSIDWFCVPAFDSSSVFGAILDEQKGGHFSISPVEPEVRSSQYYLPDTNVLVTRFLSEGGVVEVTDYMPLEKGKAVRTRHNVVRRIKGLRGQMGIRIECQPAFDYARSAHKAHPTGNGAIFSSDGLRLGLYSSVQLSTDDKAAGTEITVHEEAEVWLVLGILQPGELSLEELVSVANERTLADTAHYWRDWVSQCTYTGRWLDMIHRSALTLKLLTYSPTGAIVAAPTTSLPERIGGGRNWDYRYTWIRDASFAVYALVRIGFTEEAVRFMHWVEERAHELEADGSLQIMYSIRGEHDLTETTLDHLAGYRDSRPVRIGNGAFSQLQLDIYGELMDAAYLSNKYGSPISYDMWLQLSKMLDWVVDNWHRADEGIWETRGGKRHFTYSKMMCWVALDRGIRLAEKRSFPGDIWKWRNARNEIYLEIQDKAWNHQMQTFVQSYGHTALDASTLIMPLIFFMSPTDPRMLKTLEAIRRTPRRGGLTSNSLVYRYNVEESPDGLEGEEGAFSMCTFWLVEALTRASQADRHYLDEARVIFEQMLGYANHLGLYAEEVGPQGEALGNYPQAFTHIALISAAYNLNKALGRGA